MVWGPISKESCLIVPTKVSGIRDKILNCTIGKFTFSAIDEQEMVWVWGENKQGQLGLNDYTNRQTPYPLLSLKGKGVNEVHFGSNFSIGVSLFPKPCENESMVNIYHQASPNFAITT